jgi:hypothetical protein
MQLKPGSRWRSAVCETEVVVVRAPNGAVELECGGRSMLAHGQQQTTGALIAEGYGGGTRVGKRYADAESGLEVLCSKGGAGSLAANGRLIGAKEAKKLPSSD